MLNSESIAIPQITILDVRCHHRMWCSAVATQQNTCTPIQTYTLYTHIMYIYTHLSSLSSTLRGDAGPLACAITRIALDLIGATSVATDRAFENARTKATDTS